MPQLILQYVRKGKLKVETNFIGFLGPDSQRGRLAALAAGKQNKLFNLTQLLYDNQGAENTGWLNDDMLKSAAESIPGLDAERMMSDRNSAEITRPCERLRLAGSSGQRALDADDPRRQVGRDAEAREDLRSERRGDGRQGDRQRAEAVRASSSRGRGRAARRGGGSARRSARGACLSSPRPSRAYSRSNTRGYASSSCGGRAEELEHLRVRLARPLEQVFAGDDEQPLARVELEPALELLRVATSRLVREVPPRVAEVARVAHALELALHARLLVVERLLERERLASERDLVVVVRERPVDGFRTSAISRASGTSAAARSGAYGWKR